MKICIIVDDYMPHSIKVAAKMMHELACEFVEQGHVVSVITPEAKLSQPLVIENLDGVDIYRFKSGEIKNISKIKRAINETLLSHNAWKSCEDFFVNNPHDFIIYYSPSIFFGSLVKKLKKNWGVKSYLILRDFFPQWTIDNGLLKEKSLITKYFKFFEKINYDAADTIGVMSSKNLEWFKDYYKTEKDIEVLYNWATIDKFENNTYKYRKKLGIERKIIYFYGGNLGHAQDMMNIIRLANSMKNEQEAHFLLVGDGDEVELLKSKIDEYGLYNTTLLPSVNQQEFKQILSEVDIGLFSLSKHHKTHNFPGKLLGYMVQEIPILGSINFNNDLKEMLEMHHAGLITINGDDEQFYKNAKKLLDKETRLEVGKNGNKLLKSKFSVYSATKNIIRGQSFTFKL